MSMTYRVNDTYKTSCWLSLIIVKLVYSHRLKNIIKKNYKAFRKKYIGKKEINTRITLVWDHV